MRECRCFVNCKTLCKHKIWTSSSPRMSRFRGAPFLPPLLSFTSGLPRCVWCSQPISCLSLLQRELALQTVPPSASWQSPYEADAPSLTSPPKSLPVFREEPSPAPHLQGNWLLGPLWHTVPPTSFWSRQVSHCWVCQREHPLIFSLPACLPLLLPFSPQLTHTSLTNDLYPEAKKHKRLEKRNPVYVWFDFKCICFVARDVVTGTACSFLGEFSTSPAWFLFCFSLDEPSPQWSTLILPIEICLQPNSVLLKHNIPLCSVEFSVVPSNIGGSLAVEFRKMVVFILSGLIT